MPRELTAPPSRIESKLASELGADVLVALSDDRTEDVVLNPDGQVWLKRRGQPFTRLCVMDQARATAAIYTVASMAGVTVNHEHPVLETELSGGYRFEGLVRPVVSGPVFAIRARPKLAFTLDDYRRAGVMADVQMVALRAAVVSRLNILFVGPPGSGKTELLKTALEEIPPEDRIAIIEDVAELRCASPNVVYLHSLDSGEHRVSMLELLRAALRLRVLRIIIGEVRGKEAYSLLKAWNTGHPGGMASVHANDARSGLRRLESLAGEAPEARGIPQQPLIAEAVQMVVFIDHCDQDECSIGRIVREVATVRGWKEGVYEVQYV